MPAGAPERRPPRPETVVEVLRAAERYLAERGADAPRLSAELLLGAVLGVDRLRLYLAHDRPIDEAERIRLRPLVAERGRGVPLAYLLGTWAFHGVELEIDRSVLVPRPETEHLVDLAAERAPRGARVAEIGTGSGAVAVALAVARPDVTVHASEVSPAAAALAARNADRAGVAERVAVRRGPWWEPLQEDAPFDLLVSNPPYVDPRRPDLLAPEVRAFEPPEALFSAPGDPASSYRAILAEAGAMLLPGSWMLLETGVEAAEPALALLRARPDLVEVALEPDPARLPRYLLARRR